MKTKKNCREMKLIILLAITAAMIYGCTVSTTKSATKGGCTMKKKLDIRVMGARRYFLLHLPQGYNPDRKIPLVIVLHGAFSTPVQMEKQTGFSTLSDKFDFLVAYPSGAYGLFGYLKHWNAGHCCGKAAKDNLDDVGFLLAVMDDIQAQFPFDTSRVYMVGFSNGGMLTYRFAAEYPDRLAAAAVLGAAIGGQADAETPLWMPPKPAFPLPLIVFHAKDDQNVPYDGGISPRKRGERTYTPVAQAIDFWVKNNHCPDEPRTETLCRDQVTKTKCADPVHDNDIELYTMDKWGHRWPGRYFTSRLSQEDPLKDFAFEQIIWSFFQNRHRQTNSLLSR
ncbi:PHB depolymerase family esterase [uncultured Desulfobacter sp.]|uniref:alpha/beta hydrolase family esterase n=1 Tax=uncultured Desulfobacter sp. TaxID=240139 RepID=UPI002AAADF98|nr:PHB depolymerase family esterase [uncultured Desulfobacter sp.]